MRAGCTPCGDTAVARLGHWTCLARVLRRLVLVRATGTLLNHTACAEVGHCACAALGLPGGGCV